MGEPKTGPASAHLCVFDPVFSEVSAGQSPAADWVNIGHIIARVWLQARCSKTVFNCRAGNESAKRARTGCDEVNTNKDVSQLRGIHGNRGVTLVTFQLSLQVVVVKQWPDFVSAHFTVFICLSRFIS